MMTLLRKAKTVVSATVHAEIHTHAFVRPALACSKLCHVKLLEVVSFKCEAVSEVSPGCLWSGVNLDKYKTMHHIG